ncbi:MAG: tetratricopeptide repeat protein [bacterium]
MTATLGGTSLRDSARALRTRGAWADLTALLDEHLAEVMSEPELANARGEAYLRSGALREGRAWFAKTIPIAERQGDRPALRRALNMIGVANFRLGELDAAKQEFERALELGREDDDDLLVARATNSLGMIANIRARRERALGLFSAAIAAYQRLGDVMGLAQCYHDIAIAFRDAGDLDRADEHELRAMEFAREADNPMLLAQAWLGRAEIGHRKGDAAFAEAAALRAASEFATLPELIL